VRHLPRCFSGLLLEIYERLLGCLNSTSWQPKSRVLRFKPVHFTPSLLVNFDQKPVPGYWQHPLKRLTCNLGIRNHFLG
jgi:hypothetical protein